MAETIKEKLTHTDIKESNKEKTDYEQLLKNAKDKSSKNRELFDEEALENKIDSVFEDKEKDSDSKEKEKDSDSKEKEKDSEKKEMKHGISKKSFFGVREKYRIGEEGKVSKEELLDDKNWQYDKNRGWDLDFEDFITLPWGPQVHAYIALGGTALLIVISAVIPISVVIPAVVSIPAMVAIFAPALESLIRFTGESVVAIGESIGKFFKKLFTK